MLTPGGDLRNPVDSDRLILFYRNNRTAWYPGQRVHQGQAFDLWGASANGVRDGVNNWESTVSSP